MGLTPFWSQPLAASRWITVLITSVLVSREGAGGCRLSPTNLLSFAKRKHEPSNKIWALHHMARATAVTQKINAVALKAQKTVLSTSVKTPKQRTFSAREMSSCYCWYLRTDAPDNWRRCPVAAVASSKWMLHTGGGWGVTPHMIVKCFGCMAIHNKRYIMHHSFIHSFIKNRLCSHVLYTQ